MKFGRLKWMLVAVPYAVLLILILIVILWINHDLGNSSTNLPVSSEAINAPTVTRQSNPAIPKTDTPSATRTILLTPTPTDTLPPTSTPTPTETETPTTTPTATTTFTITPTSTFPWKANVGEIYGHKQKYNLDCESQTAVDWAAFFGVKIDELEFFGNLPKRDNPDKGFVGDVNDTWGKLPPHGYGVHAGPVAALLRDYGLQAHAYRGLTWEQLKEQIVLRKPIIVWVIGHFGLSKAQMMTFADGTSALVAPYEHTVLMVGYERDQALVIDGDRQFLVPKATFLMSWGVLRRMAVVAVPVPATSDVEELIP